MESFDLVLSYPQWQGSGRPENLRRGAAAAARICGRYGPLEHVVDAGDGISVDGVNRWTAILEQFRCAQTILHRRWPRTVLTAGGDCGCDVAVIDYLHYRYPDLTVIWIDAHLDANTARTSPSGNFHGMPVASIMGSAPGEMQALLSAPLPPAQFRYVAAHLGDEGDRAFRKGHRLAWLDPDRLAPGPVHVHFDLDALDPRDFPHVAYPDGRLSMETALTLVRKIATSGCLVGLTITEFAPADDAGAADGSDFLQRMCEAARAS